MKRSYKMNTVTIVGKIQRINHAESGKMCFITIMEKRTQNEINFIDCVCFSPEFIKRNFKENKWIGITGHLHSSKYNDEYKTDVIVDTINFIGEKTTDTEDIWAEMEKDLPFQQ